MHNRSGFDDIQSAYDLIRSSKSAIVESKSQATASKPAEKDLYGDYENILEAYENIRGAQKSPIISEVKSFTPSNSDYSDTNSEILSAYKSLQKFDEGVLGDIADKAAQMGRSAVKAVKHLMAGFSKMLSNIFGKSGVGATPEAGEIGAIHGNGFDSAKVISIADEKNIKLTAEQKDTLGEYQTQYEASLVSFIDKLKTHRAALAKELDPKLVSKFPLVPTTIFNTKYKSLLANEATKKIFEKFCVDLTSMDLKDLSYTIDNVYRSVEECIQKTPGVEGSNGKIFEDTSSVYHIMTSCLRAPFDTSKNTRMTAIVIFYVMAKLFDETYDSYIKSPMNVSVAKIKSFFNDKTLIKPDAATGILQLQIDSILSKFDKKSINSIVTPEAEAFITAIISTINAKKSNLAPLIKQLIIGLNSANSLLVKNEAGEISFGKVDVKNFDAVKVNLKDDSDLVMSYNMCIIAFNIYAIAIKDSIGLKNIDNICVELSDMYEKLSSDKETKSVKPSELSDTDITEIRAQLEKFKASKSEELKALNSEKSNLQKAEIDLRNKNKRTAIDNLKLDNLKAELRGMDSKFKAAGKETEMYDAANVLLQAQSRKNKSASGTDEQFKKLLDRDYATQLESFEKSYGLSFESYLQQVRDGSGITVSTK